VKGCRCFLTSEEICKVIITANNSLIYALNEVYDELVARNIEIELGKNPKEMKQ